MEIFKTFRIESAHYLPHVPEGHKCGRMHGHSYRIDVHVAGPLDAEQGWVMDFADIKAVCDPVFERIDHVCLNEVEGLENPTCEVLARWIWDRLKPALPALVRIVVHETCTSGCIHTGD